MSWCLLRVIWKQGKWEELFGLGKYFKGRVDRSIGYAFRMDVELDTKNLITRVWPQHLGSQ